MMSHSLSLLARKDAALKSASPGLPPQDSDQGNRIRPPAGSRSYKGTRKNCTVPKEKKDTLQKTKKKKKKNCHHLNSCGGNIFVFDEHVFQTCLNGNGLDFNGNAVLVAI